MSPSASARRLILATGLAVVLAPLFIHAQTQAPVPSGDRAAVATNGAKPITLDDYPRFKRIGGTSLSNDASVVCLISSLAMGGILVRAPLEQGGRAQ